jgi:hypothetical protein
VKKPGEAGKPANTRPIQKGRPPHAEQTGAASTRRPNSRMGSRGTRLSSPRSLKCRLPHEFAKFYMLTQSVEVGKLNISKDHICSVAHLWFHVLPFPNRWA